MRLIDADELFKTPMPCARHNGKPLTSLWAYVVDQITHAPTIDAVHVVRCKDCRYYYHSVSSFRDGRCAHFGNFDGDPCVDLNAFCSYGERKEAGGNG